MPEVPLKEYEVKFERTVYTWVRVAAKTEHTAVKLATERLEESELGSLCVQCSAHGEQDITIEENENEQADVKVVEDPTEHVILQHDFTLGEPEEDEDEDLDDLDPEP